MVIEYFYPKHLKQAINDLKAAGNYRHSPVFFHELGCGVGCVVVFFLITVFLSAGAGIWISYGLLILLVISLIRHVQLGTKNLTAYALGSPQRGIVEGVKVKGESGNSSSRTEIKIIRLSDQKKLIVPDLDDEIVWDLMNINEGSEIMFFYTDDYACYPMPHYEKFIIRYSIRKDLIPAGYK